MKLAPALRLLTLLALFLARPSFAAVVDMTVSGPSSANIGDVLNYTITLTNNSTTTFFNSQLSSVFPPRTDIVSVTNNIPVDPLNPQQNQILTNFGTVQFQIDRLNPGQIYLFNLRLRPNDSGSFTNRFLASGDGFLTQTADFVTVISAGQADLQVDFSRLPTAILANDLVTYDLIVTNRGPADALSVIVNNNLPPGSLLVANSIPSQTTIAGDVISWQVGTLANATAQTLTLTVKPTNVSTTAVFSANVNAPANTDPTTSNNSVSNTIAIKPIVTNTLAITARSAQRFNRQNALIEETVTVTNLSAVTIPQIRLFVSGIVTSNRLFNAAGTNDVTPFVTADTNLAAGTTADILVQYFFPSRQFNPNIGLLAVEGPVASFTPTNSVSTNALSLSSVFSASNNLVSLTFNTTVGRAYTVQASDEIPFTTNATVFFGPVSATNNQITFTDQIVATNDFILHPTRFFRILETR